MQGRIAVSLLSSTLVFVLFSLYGLYSAMRLSCFSTNLLFVQSQLYNRSGELLLKMQQRRSVGLKTLLFGWDKASSIGTSTGAVYALVCETLKCMNSLKAPTVPRV